MKKEYKPVVEFAGAHASKFHSAIIHFPIINALPQVRKTFLASETEDLANDISKPPGLIQPSVIAKFDEERALSYIKLNNEATHSRVALSDLAPAIIGGKRYYFIVLGGERRFRAHRILWEKGCSECRKNHAVSRHRCFKKHFGGEYMEARLIENPNPETAKSIQFKENNYISPSAHELAYSYVEYYRVRKWSEKAAGNKRYGISHFAKEVGKSSAVISRALQFVELPKQIQKSVEDGYVSYSIAVLFYRFRTIKFSDDEILRLFNLTLMKAHKRMDDVREYIERQVSISANKHSEIDFGGGLQKTRVNGNFRRKTFQKEMLHSLHESHRYLNQAAAMYRRGLLGNQRKSVFLDEGVWKIAESLVRNLKKLLPKSASNKKKRGLLLPLLAEDLGRINNHVKRINPLKPAV